METLLRRRWRSDDYAQKNGWNYGCLHRRNQSNPEKCPWKQWSYPSVLANDRSSYSKGMDRTKGCWRTSDWRIFPCTSGTAFYGITRTSWPSERMVGKLPCRRTLRWKRTSDSGTCRTCSKGRCPSWCKPACKWRTSSERPSSSGFPLIRNRSRTWQDKSTGYDRTWRIHPRHLQIKWRQ